MRTIIQVSSNQQTVHQCKEYLIKITCFLIQVTQFEIEKQSVGYLHSDIFAHDHY